MWPDGTYSFVTRSPGSLESGPRDIYTSLACGRIYTVNFRALIYIVVNLMHAKSIARNLNIIYTFAYNSYHILKKARSNDSIILYIFCV